MVCADLEGLVAAHEEADLAGLLVLEQSEVSGALVREVTATAVSRNRACTCRPPWGSIWSAKIQTHPLFPLLGLGDEAYVSRVGEPTSVKDPSLIALRGIATVQDSRKSFARLHSPHQGGDGGGSCEEAAIGGREGSNGSAGLFRHPVPSSRQLHRGSLHSQPGPHVPAV